MQIYKIRLNSIYKIKLTQADYICELELYWNKFVMKGFLLISNSPSIKASHRWTFQLSHGAPAQNYYKHTQIQIFPLYKIILGNSKKNQNLFCQAIEISMYLVIHRQHHQINSRWVIA